MGSQVAVKFEPPTAPNLADYYVNKPRREPDRTTTLTLAPWDEFEAANTPAKGFVCPSASAPTVATSFFELLQSFEGVVREVRNSTFTAEIQDMTEPINPNEIVELSIKEISRDDLALLRPGAVFYWSIGYKDTRGEPRRRVSQIRLQRRPGWSKLDVSRAKSFATEYLRIFETV